MLRLVPPDKQALSYEGIYLFVFTASILFLKTFPFSLLRAVPCPFKLMTGFPCPTCGFTRTLETLMSGQVAAAWAISPALLILLFLAPAGALYALMALVFNTRRIRLANRKSFVMMSLGLIFLLLFNWIPALAQTLNKGLSP